MDDESRALRDELQNWLSDRLAAAILAEYASDNLRRHLPSPVHA